MMADGTAMWDQEAGGLCSRLGQRRSHAVEVHSHSMEAPHTTDRCPVICTNYQQSCGEVQGDWPCAPRQPQAMTVPPMSELSL
mmetsp:Transcript_43303/g.113945  ORF Transcript_43303/g.113945 Transcript_43303/m.113945 type:complete len:83 (-) Transcript_43303:231-479(-)